MSSHPPLLSFSPLIIFSLQLPSATTSSFSLFFFSLPSPVSLPPLCSLRPVVTLFVNILTTPHTDLTTFLLLLLDPPSFHSLASVLLSQLNCYSHLHLCIWCFISHLYHVSQFCSAIITLHLNELYHILMLEVAPIHTAGHISNLAHVWPLNLHRTYDLFFLLIWAILKWAPVGKLTGAEISL